MGRPEPVSELHRQLISPKSLQTFVPGSPINLFRLFDQTGFSYKGQVTSGFGERGLRGDLKVSIDFGDLVLPGLLSAKIEGGAKLGLSRHTLLVVVRQPMQIRLGSKTWHSAVPLCLSVLGGHSTEATANVAASASAGRWSDVDELGLKLSVSANASLGGQVLDLSDACPRHYPPSAFDGLLARDFAFALETLTRHQVKNMIAAWLKSKEKTSRVTEAMKKLISDKLDSDEWQDSASEWVKEKLPKIEQLDEASADPGTLDKVWRWLSPPKSIGLLTRLDALEKLLDDDSGTDNDSDDDTKAASEQTKLTLQQIALFRAQIKSLQARKLETGDGTAPVSPRAAPVAPSRLCHLRLFAQNRQAGAKGAANLGLTLLDSDLTAEAKASYARSARLVSYRFQQQASGTTPLLITQDTALVYRDVDANRAASVNVGLKLPKLDKKPIQREGEKALCYRTMTCRSVVIYWQPPSGTQAKTIVPGAGSGVSFGIGVQASQLVQAAKHAGTQPSDSSKGSDALIKRIADQLRLTTQAVRQFLVAADISGDDPDQYVSDVVWLEAGFALRPGSAGTGTAAPSRLPVSFVRGTYRLADTLEEPSLGGAMDSAETLAAHNLVLDALRLRYRLSDGRDRTQTAFKLGFSYVAGFDITIDKVRSAGHEGVVDLFTWFAPRAGKADPDTDNDDEHKKDFNKPENLIEGHEHVVPPIAFLHQ